SAEVHFVPDDLTEGIELGPYIGRVDRHCLVRGCEHVAVGRPVFVAQIRRAAILHRLDLVPDDEAALVDAAGVDRGGDHVADDHYPADPFLHPHHLAFEVAVAPRRPPPPPPPFSASPLPPPFALP